MKTNFYAVIMAGGQGSRLWPLSRKSNPKQLHSLMTEEPMIKDTYLRLLPVFKPDKIIISTVPEFVSQIKKILPDVPAENYIVEPGPMGTAAACGLVTKMINMRDPESSLAFLPADAFIKDENKFVQILRYAKQAVNNFPDHIITLGITPTRPDTGFGYIQVDKKLESDKNLELWRVKRFVEKPDTKTAEEYISTKDYFWNGGIFIWKTDSMLKMFEQFLPRTFLSLNKIAEAVGTREEQEILEKEYAKTDKTTVDYGIMENTNKILLIPADMGWSDVGSWGSLLEVLAGLNDTDSVHRGNHVGVDSSNCLVLGGKKLIATIGLKDIVVVDTDDAILICSKEQSHKVKDVLHKLGEKYL